MQTDKPSDTRQAKPQNKSADGYAAKFADKRPYRATDIELHIKVESVPCDPVSLLAEHCELSKGRIKEVMQCGAVWLTREHQGAAHTKRLRRAKAELQLGDEVHMYYDAATIDSRPPPAELIADEGDYSVWFKPAGMYTQGTKWGDHHAIARWVEQHIQPQRTAQVIHRLDRHTSGVIMVAHTKLGARELSRLIRERKIDKHYQAIVEGEFAEVGAVVKLDADVDEKTALSFVKVLAVANGRSLLEVKIETGRKHQIRQHLLGQGFPIVGDRIYGEDDADGMRLCAISLAFESPIDGEAKCYQTPEHLRPQLHA